MVVIILTSTRNVGSHGLRPSRDSERLHGGPEQDLVHVHIGRLADGEFHHARERKKKGTLPFFLIPVLDSLYAKEGSHSMSPDAASRYPAREPSRGCVFYG